MICYVCNREGEETPAVAICIVCGMALCAKHVIREEMGVLPGLGERMGLARDRSADTFPRFMCRECYRALGKR